MGQTGCPDWYQLVQAGIKANSTNNKLVPIKKFIFEKKWRAMPVFPFMSHETLGVAFWCNMKHGRQINH